MEVSLKKSKKYLNKDTNSIMIVLEGQLSSQSDWFNNISSSVQAQNSQTLIVNMFMPPYKQCTMRFLRDDLKGTKILIKLIGVIRINVSYFLELSLKRVWDEVKEVEDLKKYLNTYDDANELTDQNFFKTFSLESQALFDTTINIGWSKINNKQGFVEHNQQGTKIKFQSAISFWNSQKTQLSQVRKDCSIKFNIHRKGQALSLLRQGSSCRRVTKKRKLNQMTFSYSDYVNSANQNLEEQKEGKEIRNIYLTPQKQKLFNI